MEREWDSWLMNEEKCVVKQYKNREGYSGNLKKGM